MFISLLTPSFCSVKVWYTIYVVCHSLGQTLIKWVSCVVSTHCLIVADTQELMFSLSFIILTSPNPQVKTSVHKCLEYHWCYTDPSCGPATWGDHYEVRKCTRNISVTREKDGNNQTYFSIAMVCHNLLSTFLRIWLHQAQAL